MDPMPKGNSVEMSHGGVDYLSVQLVIFPARFLFVHLSIQCTDLGLHLSR